MEEETRTNIQKWKSARKWRVTASVFGSICKATERKDLGKLCKSMYNPPDLNVPSIRHGRTYESKALKVFSEKTGKTILKSGLCVLPELPFLGATPDAFVQNEDAVCEVKCPYKARKCNISPEHIDFLEEKNGKIRLKRNNNYFYQIIGQMKLSGKSHCYFIVYTFEDMFYEKIALDDAFFTEKMLPKLSSFYDNEYCPFVASALGKKGPKTCSREEHNSSILGKK